MARIPRLTGSYRALTSPEGLEDAARRIVRQVAVATQFGRPVAWLALVLFDLDRSRPPGARRADARRHAALVAALLAISGDYRSGRRSRPGRQVSAAVAGLSERTVERLWRLLERRGLIQRTKDGRLLRPSQRIQELADPWRCPDEQDERWRDRQEWSLAIPAWVRDVQDVALLPFLDRAAEVLSELAARVDAPALVIHKPAVDIDGSAVDGAVDNGGPVVDRAVDNAAAHARDQRSVARSLGVEILLGSLPLRRGFSSAAGRVERGPSRPAGRRGVEEQKGRPSGVSSTRGVRPASGRRMPRDVARLAREAVVSERLPFLRGFDHLPSLCGALKALRGWTVDDLVMAIERRLRACGKPMLDRVDRPLSYLRWLLQDVDPARPPAQEARRHAAEERERSRARTLARRAAAAARTAAAVPASSSTGGRAARLLVDELAARRRAADLDAARRREQVRALLEPAVAVEELACVGGCHGYGTHVVMRGLPGTNRAVPLCDPCWEQARIPR